MFEARHKPVFGEEDVVNMFPVVKHIKPTASDATRLVQHAQVAVQQGKRHRHNTYIINSMYMFILRAAWWPCMSSSISTLFMMII